MWTLSPDNPLPRWRCEGPRHVALAFSTRRGGVSKPPYDSLNLGRSTEDLTSAVSENRRRLLVAMGLEPERLATAGQVHGDRVREVTEPGHHPDCDALVTRVPGIALAVTTADCMSLLYVVRGATGVAHSGWRGTASGMPVAALVAVADVAGVTPADVEVHVGPCIRGCCYEVGADVASRFPAEAVRARHGRTTLDLPTASRRALLDAGVRPDAIHDTGACTACEPHWYFSHRRDHGRTGRLWGVAALVSPS